MYEVKISSPSPLCFFIQQYKNTVSIWPGKLELDTVFFWYKNTINFCVDLNILLTLPYTFISG